MQKARNGRIASNNHWLKAALCEARLEKEKKDQRGPSIALHALGRMKSFFFSFSSCHDRGGVPRIFPPQTRT